nr:hypothetical protein [Tanacetum cinerariifolium]
WFLVSMMSGAPPPTHQWHTIPHESWVVAGILAMYGSLHHQMKTKQQTKDAKKTAYEYYLTTNSIYKRVNVET